MEKKELSIKTASISLISGFIFGQFLSILTMAIGLIICRIFNVSTDSYQAFFNSSLGYLFLNLALDFGLILACLLSNRNAKFSIIKKPTLKKICLYLLLAVASFLLLYPIVNCFDNILLNLGVTPSTLPYKLDTKGYIISIFSLALLPAIAEEILFRGSIFKGLAPYGKIFSILLSAVMFMLFHMSITQMIYPLLMGLLLAFIMSKEDNILYCIIVHFTNNLISLTLSYFNINLTFNHWTYYLIAILAVIIFITFLIFAIKKLKREKTKVISKEDKIYLISSLAIIIILWLGIVISNQFNIFNKI